MNTLSVFRLIVVFIIVLFANACGGGGGGSSSSSSSDTFTLSTSTLNFVAESPSSSVAAQSITGTVNGDISGTLYILITSTGNAVASISSVTIDNNTQSGTALVYPVNASTLGAGTYTSTITVRACLNDPTCSTGELTGSPKTVTVNYEVKSPVLAENVMPHVAKSGVAGDVIIRGNNFITDNISSVSFNATAAANFSIISETEIRATYPVLSSGSYAVKLGNTSGDTSFSGSLVVIDSPNFSAGTLLYPSSPGQVLATIYDAEREVLFIAASDFNSSNFNTTSRQTNRILQYQFSNGSFVSINTTVIPLLQGMALSPDGSQLLVITDKQILHLDATNMVQTNSTTLTGLYASNRYFKNIVVTNDGNAIITTAYIGSGSTSTYVYSILNAELTRISSTFLYNGSSGVSADGSKVIFIEGSVSPAQPLREYSSSTGLFSILSANENQKQCINSYMGRCIYPVVDKTGNRIAIIDGSITTDIYDSSFTLLGQLPITTELVAFNADGTRIYAYDSSSTLRTYDLTASTIGGMFPEIGSGTTLAGSPGSGVQKMILSADGSTLFITGTSSIVIQPAP